jgi:micrococcal nuclease
MKSKIAVIFFVLFIVIVAVREMYLRKQSPETEIFLTGDKEALGDFDTAAQMNRQRFRVARVVDGDTVKIKTGETLRYIGIDTPETKHPKKPVQYFGKEASAFNKQLVDGKVILVEFDVTQRDKYGRLLGYVFLPDGTFVNAELVRKGYAQVWTIPPNVRYQDFFLQLQREAQKNKRGLWQKE